MELYTLKYDIFYLPLGVYYYIFLVKMLSETIKSFKNESPLKTFYL